LNENIGGETFLRGKPFLKERFSPAPLSKEFWDFGLAEITDFAEPKKESQIAMKRHSGFPLTPFLKNFSALENL